MTEQVEQLLDRIRKYVNGLDDAMEATKVNIAARQEVLDFLIESNADRLNNIMRIARTTLQFTGTDLQEITLNYEVTSGKTAIRFTSAGEIVFKDNHQANKVVSSAWDGSEWKHYACYHYHQLEYGDIRRLEGLEIFYANLDRFESGYFAEISEVLNKGPEKDTYITRLFCEA